MSPLSKHIAVILLIFGAIMAAHHARSQVIYGNPTAMAQSTTGESSHVFKATPGYAYSLGVTTSAAGYLMVFDATSAPSNGAVAPANCYAVAANSSFYIPYASPFPFGTGITAVYSTTGCFTQTLANAFFSGQVR